LSVAGSEIPETTNSPLVRLPDVTVTAAPLAVRLPVRAALAPTTTLPKLRLVGDTANWPAAVPVPESAMLSGEFVALETTDRVPLAAAALVGPKTTVNVTLWPAASVVGTFNPLIENTAPVAVACEIVTDDPPVFVNVSDRLALLPT
jgi:hypothetical protein